MLAAHLPGAFAYLAYGLQYLMPFGAGFPLTLAEHGNTASASVPFTLAKHQEQLSSGDRVLLMGIGSGLNTSFAELAW